MCLMKLFCEAGSKPKGWARCTGCIEKPKHVPQHPLECRGCENIQIEKDAGGTGHCYMFREFIHNCQLYKKI